MGLVRVVGENGFRSARHLSLVGVASAGLLGGLIAVAAPAQATPLFKAPYACGQGWTASTYGGHGGNGNAVDFNLYPGQVDLGQPTLASAGGTVTYRGENAGRAGNYLTIDHGDGWTTQYMHLQTMIVNAGQIVAAGQQIGTVGNTGTGHPHLHYRQNYSGVAQPVSFDGTIIAVGTSYASGDPIHASTNCGQQPVSTPPASIDVQRSTSATVRAVKRKSVLRVTVNPSSSNTNYKFKVQRKARAKWKRVLVTYTKGSKDSRKLNLWRGKYRVKVPVQNGLTGSASNPIRLRR